MQRLFKGILVVISLVVFPSAAFAQASIVGTVRDASGAVLFQRRADDGTWGLHAGAVDPGGVEEGHLEVGPGEDAEHAVARGLRLGADDGELLSEHAIEQRALAHVGSPDDRAEAGSVGRVVALLRHSLHPGARLSGALLEKLAA